MHTGGYAYQRKQEHIVDIRPIAGEELKRQSPHNGTIGVDGGTANGVKAADGLLGIDARKQRGQGGGGHSQKGRELHDGWTPRRGAEKE